MPVFRSDELLWYNVGVWGQLGYGVPNFGDNPTTLNGSIAYLVSAIGRNLSAVMHHSDADSRTPPSYNTLMRVHKLCCRVRQILAGRAIPANQPRFEPTHATPAPEDFILFPIPIFKVRNPFLKEWASLTMHAIGEACQHTDNRIEYEISDLFAGGVGQYFQRIYLRMATELFQVPIADASKPDFVLQDKHFQSYLPSQWFTLTELIDTVPPLDLVPTEDDLRVLTDGIPASQLIGLTHYPSGQLAAEATTKPTAPQVAAQTVPPFPAAPGP
jgi:hypothetical protein